MEVALSLHPTSALLPVRVGAASPAPVAEDNEDTGDGSRLLLSTSTRPYIPEELSCHEPTTEDSTPVFNFKALTERPWPVVDETTPPPQPTWQPHDIAADSIGESSLVCYSSCDPHARLMPRCPSASPFLPTGLPCCLADSSVTGAASLTPNSTLYGCGVTTGTLDNGHSAIASLASRLSSPSAMLRLGANHHDDHHLGHSDEGSLLPSSYFLQGTEEGGVRASNVSLSQSSSLWKTQTTAARTTPLPVLTSAYRRFERAVQRWPLAMRDGAESGARDAAMMAAAEQMALCSSLK